MWSYSATLSFDADRSPQPSSPTTLTGPAPSAHPPPPFPRTISLADALSRLLALSTAPLDTQDSDPASVIDKVERYSSCKTGSYWSKRYDEFRPRLLFRESQHQLFRSCQTHNPQPFPLLYTFIVRVLLQLPRRVPQPTSPPPLSIRLSFQFRKNQSIDSGSQVALSSGSKTKLGGYGKIHATPGYG